MKTAQFAKMTNGQLDIVDVVINPAEGQTEAEFLAEMAELYGEQIMEWPQDSLSKAFMSCWVLNKGKISVDVTRAAAARKQLLNGMIFKKIDEAERKVMRPLLDGETELVASINDYRLRLRSHINNMELPADLEGISTYKPDILEEVEPWKL